MSELVRCAGCNALCRPADRFCSQCGRAAPGRGSGDQPTHAADPDATMVTGAEAVASAATEDRPLPSGSVFARRYHIDRLLGEGGMGRVYAATDTSIDEKIAVKILSAMYGSSATVLNQFKRELKLARRVRHRNVVASFHLGEAEGRSYITMEYVEAESLSAYLSRKGALPEGEMLAILRQVLRGLRAAHDLGIVHRDIKASNILINKDRMAFITDFGIATTAAAGVDRHLAGTPQYMAPELFAGAPGTPAADLYACGVLIYHLLTQRFPFPGKGFNDMSHAHRTQAPDPIPAGRPVSGLLRDLYQRLLAKDPLARPQRAVEVLEVVERVLAVDALTVKTGRPVALVVHQDPSVLALCREVLDAEGYHVESAARAQEGIELAFAHDPSFVVLNSHIPGGEDLSYSSDASMTFVDQLLPGHGGLGFCRMLQSDRQLRRVPILIATDDRGPGIRSAFTLMGASEVLAAPFDAAALRVAIQAAREAAILRSDDR